MCLTFGALNEILYEVHLLVLDVINVEVIRVLILSAWLVDQEVVCNSPESHRIYMW